MATTTNFNWSTPDDTALVKDGAAAIRTLGSSIDTSFVDLKGGTTGQVLAKASGTDLDFTWATDASGIPATIFDAKGDIIAASAADTAARLAVGTNGQVLKANSATATGLEWGSAAAGQNFSLLGSVATTSGTTATVSGISGINSIYIVLKNVSMAATGAICRIRINSDTGSNYKYGSVNFNNQTTYYIGWLGSSYTTGQQFEIGQNGGNQLQAVSGGMVINGCATAGLKMATWQTAFNNDNTTAQNNGFLGTGIWDNSATVSSVSLVMAGSTFDAGEFLVYGAA